jgi:hypothetical protein
MSILVRAEDGTPWVNPLKTMSYDELFNALREEDSERSAEFTHVIARSFQHALIAERRAEKRRLREEKAAAASQ